MSGRLYQNMIQDFIEFGNIIMLTVIDAGNDGQVELGEKAYFANGQLKTAQRQSSLFWQDELSNLSFDVLPSIIPLKQGVRVLVERISRKPSLVICGGGHISMPLVQIAHMLDYDITVIDDRIEFANHARFPLADKVICAPFIEGLKQCGAHEDTYFVIVTRGHSHDRFCLDQILQKPFAYVGMIGSKRKVGIVKDYLKEQGVSEELIERVNTPIGLSIGAQTPQEIAVSICAELIQVKSKLGRVGAIENALVEALSKINEPMALATIIDKRGSSPRSIGARMLVKSDGSIIGSVGGGYAEYEVQQKGLEVMKSKRSVVLTSCMTNDDAEKDGMVCGGTITVLIEPIIV